MNHPIKSIYTDNLPVSKGGIRNYETLSFKAEDVNDVQTRDLTGTLYVVAPIEVDGKIVARWFMHDPDDEGLTPHNGTTVLVDLMENRFKYYAVLPSDINAALINQVLGNGGLDPQTIPGAGARTFLGRIGGTWAERTMSTLVDWLDNFIGGIFWRTDSAALVSGAMVQALASGEGMCGGLSRAVLLNDGTVAVAGSSSTSLVTGDPAGGTIGRFVRVNYVDGVQRVAEEIWQGNMTLFVKDEDGVTWAMGQNGNGELGLGNTTDRAVLTKIQYFIDNGLVVDRVIPVPIGDYSNGTFFLMTNGHLYYAGHNQYGQAGDASTTQRTQLRFGAVLLLTSRMFGLAMLGALRSSRFSRSLAERFTLGATTAKAILVSEIRLLLKQLLFQLALRTSRRLLLLMRLCF